MHAKIIYGNPEFMYEESVWDQGKIMYQLLQGNQALSYKILMAIFTHFLLLLAALLALINSFAKMINADFEFNTSILLRYK